MSRKIPIEGTVYNIRDSIDVAGGLEHLRRFSGIAPHTPIDQVETALLKKIADDMSDVPFLIERLVIDVDGGPVQDVPFWHVPLLVIPLREALHIGKFIEAMGAAVKDEDAEPEADGGPEKNL